MKKLFLIIVVMLVSLSSFEQGVVVRQEDSKGQVRKQQTRTSSTRKHKKPIHRKRTTRKTSYKQKPAPAPQNETQKPGHHTNMDNNNR